MVVSGTDSPPRPGEPARSTFVAANAGSQLLAQSRPARRQVEPLIETAMPAKRSHQTHAVPHDAAFNECDLYRFHDKRGFAIDSSERKWPRCIVKVGGIGSAAGRSIRRLAFADAKIVKSGNCDCEFSATGCRVGLWKRNGLSDSIPTGISSSKTISATQVRSDAKGQVRQRKGYGRRR